MIKIKNGIETITYGDSRGSKLWGGVKLILPFYIFKEMIRNKQTFRDLYNFENDYLEIRRRFCGNCCNSNTFLNYKDKNFIFYIHENDEKEFILWADDRITTLGTIKIDFEESPTENFIKSLTNILDDYIGGIIHCSDCEIKVNKNEISGRYFAGVYCDKCWNEKWKDIAAKETYN